MTDKKNTTKDFVKEHFGHYYSKDKKIIKVCRILVTPIRKLKDFTVEKIKVLYNKI